jgi:hypothetical protein
MRFVCTIAFASALIGGCAATGPENSSQLMIDTPLSSEQTFRNLNKPMRECFSMFSYTANFFPEAKEGEIALNSQGDIFKAQWIYIEVKPSPAGATAKVTYRNVFQPYTAPLKEWAHGRPAACPA